MEKIIGTAVIALIGVLIWYLKAQTSRSNNREEKRDDRDAKREDKLLEIVDVTLKNVEKVVVEDSKNTKSLRNTIENHLVHSIKDLTIEVSKMNGKK